MSIDLVLYQPDIAANTGALLRLGACLDAAIHLIHPAGFAVTRQNLSRAGLDYVDQAQLIEHDSFEAFDHWRKEKQRRLLLLTTKAKQSPYNFAFAEGDLIMLGRESAGVPDDVAGRTDVRLRIPMRPGLRSLNVAMTGAIILSEALRQTDHFTQLA